MIAHRLDALANCDAVYCLEHGRVVATGILNELRPRPAMAGHRGQITSMAAIDAIT